jgi:hypothetical protein
MPTNRTLFIRCPLVMTSQPPARERVESAHGVGHMVGGGDASPIQTATLVRNPGRAIGARSGLSEGFSC